MYRLVNKYKDVKANRGGGGIVHGISFKPTDVRLGKCFSWTLTPLPPCYSPGDAQLAHIEQCQRTVNTALTYYRVDDSNNLLIITG